MRWLLHSEAGDGVGLALRLQREGHSVCLYPRYEEAADMGKGLIRKPESSFGSTLIFDCTGSGVMADRFREASVDVFSASSFHDNLENDREYAEQVMHAAGIATPESISSTDWEQAAKAIQSIESEKIVLKPEGALSGVVPSAVCADQEEAMKMLERMKAIFRDSPQLTVQEFVEGVAVSTEGWFNGEDWQPGMFNHTLERKQFLNDDQGPSGGCSGNVVWGCEASDPIIRKALLPLTDLLRENCYCGPIDINCLLNEKKLYGLEFTPRFGYDAFPTLLTGLCDFEFGRFVDDCVHRRISHETLSPYFAAGIRLTLSPYPYKEGKAESGIVLRGFSERSQRMFYPYGVCLSKDGELESCGPYGILGVMNGTGEITGEAFARAYLNVSDLQIPDVQYRTDLCERMLEDYRKLREILTGEEQGWLGVDLDKTLAKGSPSAIGEPIPAMVERVRRWVRDGKEVRILTARANDIAETVKTYDWLKETFGYTLEVTSKKDHLMIRLYDDRAKEIEANTGELA